MTQCEEEDLLSILSIWEKLDVELFYENFSIDRDLEDEKIEAARQRKVKLSKPSNEENAHFQIELHPFYSVKSSEMSQMLKSQFLDTNAKISNTNIDFNQSLLKCFMVEKKKISSTVIQQLCKDFFGIDFSISIGYLLVLKVK